MTVGFPQPLGRSFHVRSPQRASPLRSGAQRVRSPLRPVNNAADATSPPPKPRTPPRPSTPPPALFKSSPPKVSTPKVSTPLAVRMPACAPIPPRTPSTPIDALRGIDVDDDACAADLLCEAVASHRKSVALSARRAAAPASPDEAWPAAEEPPSPPPPPLPESDEEEPAAPVSVAVEALSAVAAESRGRLATALLALLNSASETELRDVLAGIGAVRARLIVETRSERLFESLDDAFGRIGLSAKQASNLTLANLRQILASRPTTSPRKRDGARARRSYRKSGRVLARKEGDDPKREYPATIVKVHDCGTVYDIKYDDGTTWKNAPAEVVRLR
uniref:Tudor domain-containing protein n=1 Tax=Pelagomonas calceolata TaxID=35677 RepID=A0A7S3ZL90_9STRA